MALGFYVTCTLFQCIENVHLKDEIKMLCHNEGLLPNRKKLATTLHKSCHSELMIMVKERMQDETLCLVANGWTNIKNDAVLTYIAIPPMCILYLEALQQSQQSYDHEFISTYVLRVFETYMVTSFAYYIMDNTNANKKAWALLQEKFPSRFLQGCT